MLKKPFAALSGALVLAALAPGVAPTSPTAFDLGVEVPPGSPLDWTRALPARTPGRGAMFPRTPGGAVAFAALRPMRAVPHRVVVLLGMGFTTHPDNSPTFSAWYGCGYGR